jgi:ribosomal protein L16 Arg81 hydroxylase
MRALASFTATISWREEEPMSITTMLCGKRLWIAGLIAAFSIAALAQMEPRAKSFMHAMKDSMERMDNGMKSAPMNGNIDHDFATMMTPHHQGAIDMAKAELLYGKDPVMRRLAEEIVVDQQSEIQAMQLWLSKQPTTTPEGRK